MLVGYFQKDTCKEVTLNQPNTRELIITEESGFSPPAKTQISDMKTITFW